MQPEQEKNEYFLFSFFSGKKQKHVGVSGDVQQKPLTDCVVESRDAAERDSNRDLSPGEAKENSAP